MPSFNRFIERITGKKGVSGALRILIPLYATYAIFVLSLFFVFVPEQKRQILENKKGAIHQLTDSVISLLQDYETRIQQKEISKERAQTEAISQIRTLRYGSQGKDYFWILNYDTVMVLNPYQTDLEGRSMKTHEDPAGNIPAARMIDEGKKEEGGFVRYVWQWNDNPLLMLSKIAYVKSFPDWEWIIGTGVYEADIQKEIQQMAGNFTKILGGILVFIVLLSFYITAQVFRMEKKKTGAEQARAQDESRLEKLLGFSQLSGESLETLTRFALKEAMALTQSQSGWLAFVDEQGSVISFRDWLGPDGAGPVPGTSKPFLPLDQSGVWAEPARTGNPVIIDLETDQIMTSDLPGTAPARRLMSVPVYDKENITALAVVGGKPAPYDQADLRQLRLMMDGMWQILQKNRAESRLRKSEARYRLLAENATDVIWVMQLSPRQISYVSPSVKALMGYDPEQFMALDISRYITPDSLTQVNQIITQQLEKSSPDPTSRNEYYTQEIQVIRKDGTLFWAEVTARFLTNSEGQVDQLLGITRDIHQRKDLETQLRTTNTDLMLAQQMAVMGSWTMDTETGKLTWSDEVYRIYEHPMELGPMDLDQLKRIHLPKWENLFRNALLEAVEKGRSFDIEISVRILDQHEKWIHIICMPESKPGSTGYLLRGTVQDITQRKTMESRVQQSLKMEALGTLAGGIAHDFNNILASIMGFTELAKLKATNRPDLLDNLDQVLAGGLRARDLVQHILIFSRKADLKKIRFQLSPLIKESLKFLRASVPPHIEIQQDLGTQKFSVLADPTQMHQVLMNLFTNAVQAMGVKGGTLRIAVEQTRIPASEDVLNPPPSRPGLRLIVSDTGCGIPAHLQGKIFEPFFTTKPRGEGTGMGLSLVYGIVRDMGGKIQVFSTQGQGTRFEILIPEAPGHTPEPRTILPGPAIKGQASLLMVDDEPSIIEYGRQALTELGYQVTAFQDPVQAFTTFTNKPGAFDLVLSDLAMPRMNGLELVDRIRALAPDIPVILCTGFSEGLDPGAMAAKRINQVIMKPVITAELAQAIHQALAQSRSHL